MDGQQIPSDIDILDAYLRIHQLPAETPDAPWLRGNDRVPGGMAGVTIRAPLPTHCLPTLLFAALTSACATAERLVEELHDDRQRHAADECLVQIAKARDEAQRLLRLRAEALRAKEPV